MISRSSPALAAAALVLATAGLFFACGDDETGTAGAGGQAAGTSTGGSGAQAAGTGTGGSGAQAAGTGTGGSGAQAGGTGTGGSGGGLSSTDVCMQACEAIVACGGSGGGGPTLPDCVAPCYELLDSCSQDELAAVLACMTPHLNPNCDDTAFFACVNALACTS